LQRIVEEEILPHVYTSGAKSHVMLSQGGRFALPDGTIRQIGDVSAKSIIIS
jgi:antiviral helicase SLH1